MAAKKSKKKTAVKGKAKPRGKKTKTGAGESRESKTEPRKKMKQTEETKQTKQTADRSAPARGKRAGARVVDELPLFASGKANAASMPDTAVALLEPEPAETETASRARGAAKAPEMPAVADEGDAEPAADMPEAAGEVERAGAPNGRRRKERKSYETAESIGKRQREISISEFFAKNRHLLGFDSLPKALVTAVKEAVDNSLDACEEAGLLPDLLVEIREITENRYRVIIEDSGPGIVKAQVPKIFGKLLYGSKFHVLKQARGQQGIGISAAVMYSQLTTGKPVKVTTRTNPRQPAQVYEIQIHTKTNSPVIISEATQDWDRPHGTRVDIEILAAYKKGQRSVDEYLHQVALANPHARIAYRSPKDPEVVYERLAKVLPVEAKAIRPHPQGIELGVLLDMLKMTHARNVKAFLQHEFSRTTARVSDEILTMANIAPSTSPKRITREQADELIRAFGRAKIMKPPTDCLSPIGEELLLHSVAREAQPAFSTAVTRPPAVYRGNPFQVEAALAFGGSVLPEDEILRLYRFANRAPLVYQQSACAMTNAVMNTAWKSYGVSQSKGALPSGPLLVLVHIASAWVPFTSEGKEAIAHYPEIIKEIKLALQECGRQLARFIRRGAKAKEEAKKRSYIDQYIPHVGAALKEILALSEKEEDKVVDTLRDILEKSRSF